MEISGEIYLKYVAFYLSLWPSFSLWTNAESSFICAGAISLFQSQQDRTTITAGAQSGKLQVMHTMKPHTHAGTHTHRGRHSDLGALDKCR